MRVGVFFLNTVYNEVECCMRRVQSARGSSFHSHCPTDSLCVMVGFVMMICRWVVNSKLWIGED